MCNSHHTIIYYINVNNGNVCILENLGIDNFNIFMTIVGVIHLFVINVCIV